MEQSKKPMQDSPTVKIRGRLQSSIVDTIDKRR